MASKLKKGDTVIVLAGKDRGKKGKILRIYPQVNRALVEGINLVKKNLRKTQQTPNGGITEIEARIHLSNLMLVDPHSGKPTRVGHSILSDGTKKRLVKRSQEVID